MRFFALTAAMTRIGRADTCAIHLEDREVSRTHAVVHLAKDRIRIGDADSANGVIVDGSPVSSHELRGGEVVRIGGCFLRFFADGTAPASTEHAVSTEGIVAGPRFDRTRDLIDSIAGSDLPVLVLGETGTGKELVARRIHQAGPRSSGPFVAINCAALPEQLVESELFGHIKGAFTGAGDARPGLFREAEGGTLLLDEIGELPAAAQAKLLRALEERRVRPVGGTGELDVDVRIVAATHRDLDAEVERGGFRRDLHARVARLMIQLPPLQARIEDLPLLARHLAPGRALSADAVELLCREEWKQNVRGLASAMERAAFRAGEATTLEPEHFEELTEPVTTEPIAADSVAKPAAVDPEREELVAMLERYEGRVDEVADALEISRSQLYRRARKLGVRVSDHRPHAGH